MKNWLVVAVVVLLAGCSAPKYSGNALPEANNVENITIVEDVKTRSIFLDSMLDWCLNNQVKCKVVADGSEHNPEDITLDYVSRWSWDFRTFVADAKISAYQDQQRVGNVFTTFVKIRCIADPIAQIVHRLGKGTVRHHVTFAPRPA